MIPSKWASVIKRFISNAKKPYFFRSSLIVLASAFRKQKRRSTVKRNNHPVPGSVFIEITKKCNLQCKGCISTNPVVETLSELAVEKAVDEAVRLGTNSFIFLGGEPFLYLKTILHLACKYPYHNFNIVTNGTLIDNDAIKKLLSVPNVLLFLSVDGTLEYHERRRGEGTMNQTMKGIGLLKKNKIPFIVSCTATKDNLDVVITQDFSIQLKKMGAYMLLLLPYLSTGCESDSSYRLSRTENARMKNAIENLNKSIDGFYVFDVFNNEIKFGGCRAADRSIMISASGDVLPCPALMFANSNIYRNTLSESLRDKLFCDICELKKTSCSCLLLENKDMLSQLIRGTSNVKITSPSFKAIIQDGFFT